MYDQGITAYFFGQFLIPRLHSQNYSCVFFASLIDSLRRRVRVDLDSRREEGSIVSFSHLFPFSVPHSIHTVSSHCLSLFQYLLLIPSFHFIVLFIVIPLQFSLDLFIRSEEMVGWV